VVVVGVGAGVCFGVIHKDGAAGGSTGTSSGTNSATSGSSDDFQRTGENSFGVAVCDEMTKDKVAAIINKPVIKTQDYSNTASTGCEYFISATGFVIIDVGFTDFADQKLGLKALDRTFKTESRIKLENFMAYTEKGLTDIYMNVAPGKKYVRVGRSSTTAVDDETLIKLAIATEAKIRSYK